MMGPELAATSVANYLRWAVPVHLDRIRASQNLDINSLPGVKLVTAADLGADLRIGPSSFPALSVLPEQLSSIQPVEIHPGNLSTYQADYTMAIEGYVAAQEPEQAGLVNRRFAAAVRSALLSTPSLRKTPEVTVPGTPKVLIDTIAEEYSPVLPENQSVNNTGRWVASFRTSFTLRQIESPYGDPVETFQSTALSIKPIHPAL